MSWRRLLSAAGMPIRQRGTLFGLTRVAIPVLKKAMATQAEGLPDHIALIQYSRSGFVIPVRPDPNYDILGKSGPLQPAHMHIFNTTYLLLVYIWLIAIMYKTYGRLKFNH